MSRHGTAHWDVAAYALGVLEPAEVVRCEAHLAECESCAAELDALLPATKVLADVDLDSLREAEESAVPERLMEAVRVERVRARRRQRLIAAGGTMVATAVAGAALLAGASWFDTSPVGNLADEPTTSASPTIPPGVGGPELGDGEHFTATDPRSGVQAQAILTSSDWGTQVSFALAGVAGPLECQLQVVREDGSVEVIGSWQVPEEGYGTEQRPEPLLVQAPTATERPDIDQLRIIATAPDGSVSTLVSISA